MKNLKKIRMKRNLTQLELARKAKTTTAAISRYETGLRTPNINTSKRIANALNVTIEQLIN